MTDAIIDTQSELSISSLTSRFEWFFISRTQRLLYGGDANYPLSIDPRNLSARFIRIKSERQNNLKLENVTINTTEQGALSYDIDVIANTSTSRIQGADDETFSTASSRSDSRCQNSTSGQRGQAALKVKDTTSLTIDLKTSRDISSIDVFTKKNSSASSDWLISVDVSHDRKSWRQVHSQAESVSSACKDEINYARKIFDKDEFRVYASSIEIVQRYIETQKISIREIDEHCVRKKLNQFESSVLKLCLNTLLKHFQLEISAHGIRRSFRFWSSSEKQFALNQANKLLCLLNDNVGPATLGFGSVLGAVRENDFIEHDDDIDLIVFHESFIGCEFADATKDLFRKLHTLGCDVRQATDFHLKVKVSSNIYIDVFCGLERDGKIDWHPGKKKVHVKQNIFPGCSYNLFGMETLLPSMTELYLENVYGSNWRIPQPFFSHNHKKRNNFSLNTSGLPVDQS